MKPRKRTCKVCRTKFMPADSFQWWCSPKCGTELAMKKVEQKRKSEDVARRKAAAKLARQEREQKRKVKSRTEVMREAQAAFNEYIRERDRDRPCISCGREHIGQWHAGHYRSTGAAPELRFNELNVHKQCMPCNAHKSGNIVEYRIRLVERIGQTNVEWLEGPHEPCRWTNEELEEIKSEYRRRARELRRTDGAR